MFLSDSAGRWTLFPQYGDGSSTATGAVAGAGACAKYATTVYMPGSAAAAETLKEMRVDGPWAKYNMIMIREEDNGMGISNYTNMSELMNEILKTGAAVSVSDLAAQAGKKKLILASEGTLADKGDLENGFIDLLDALYKAGAVRPEPVDETERHLIRLYESGKLAENGYGGKEGDLFIEIKWIALTDDLPVYANL
jgi:hypothetical protein